MEISVCDMRGAGKPGYVAKLLDGNELGFLSAKSYSSHGSSRKTVTYEVSESEYGILILQHLSPLFRLPIQG